MMKGTYLMNKVKAELTGDDGCIQKESRGPIANRSMEIWPEARWRMGNFEREGFFPARVIASKQALADPGCDC